MKYSEQFSRKARDCGHEFYYLKEDASEELQDFVKEVHQGIFNALPNDWIFETIHDAFCELENDILEDITIEADAYPKQLHDWLGHGFADEFCQEAIDEGYWHKRDGIMGLIERAQELAKQRVYDAVNEFMEQHPIEEGETENV